MGAHALLSASSSHRWLHCTPSARLEINFENESSSFAAEGTAAHALAEHKLRKILGIQSIRPTSKFDGDELEEYTDIYVDYANELIAEARSHCPDAIVLIEQKLDFSEYVPGGFGTGDLVIVADHTLDVVDLKYGKGVAVSAMDNPQMMLYALGTLSLFDSLYDIQTVRMAICQPRLENISVCVMSVDELKGWAEKELKPKAQLASKGEGEYISGDHCRFCRARRTCRARTERSLQLARFEFKRPALLSDEEVAEVLEQADRIAAWASDVWAYATEAAINQGKKWTGLKLVEGRSNRRFTDESAVTNAVLQAGYTDTQIHKRFLIGITEMEKLLGKKRFEEVLSGLVEKPKGKPTLVPLSDKRQEIKNTAMADFTED